MTVLHTELGTMRAHLAKLAREGLVSGVSAPLQSLASGAGTVFEVREELLLSRDGGRTFSKV